MKQFNEYYYNLIQTQNFYSNWKNIQGFVSFLCYSFIAVSSLAYDVKNFEMCSTLNLCLVLCLCMLGYITEKLENNIKV